MTLVGVRRIAGSRVLTEEGHQMADANPLDPIIGIKDVCDEPPVGVGQKVRVELEGEVLYQGGDPSSPSYTLHITGDKAGLYHIVRVNATGVTVELLTPETRLGQVWQTDHQRWLVRASATDPDRKSLYGSGGTILFEDEFFSGYPTAELIMEGMPGQ